LHKEDNFDLKKMHFDFYNSVIRPNENDKNDIYIMDEGNNDFYKYKINIVDPITGLNVAKSTFKIEEINIKYWNFVIYNIFNKDVLETKI